jgi:hypothetical protein
MIEINRLLDEINVAEFPEELSKILNKANSSLSKLRGHEARAVAAIIATRCKDKLLQLTPEMRGNDNIKNYDDIRG